MKGREIILTLAMRYGGDWEKEVAAVRRHEYLSNEDIEEAKRQFGEGKYVTLIDPEYPAALKNVWKPPLCLFYEGDFSLIEKEEKCVTYIGSREASSYGLKMARKLAKGISEAGYHLVTGLAKGIDTEAAKGALEAGGNPVAVLGCGVDICYPASSRDTYQKIKQCGLLLSEYPPGTKPDSSHFPMRNRLLAGLSRALIVGEAKRKSGTKITVDYAVGLTKEIGCVPFPAGEDSLCNALINQGAYLVEDIRDILFMLGDKSEKEEIF